MGLIGFAYNQSVDNDDFGALNPLADETVFIANKDIMVPAGYNNLQLAYYLCAVGDEAYLDSPSLRAISRQSISPIDVAAEPTSLDHMCSYQMNPPQLQPGEALNAYTKNTGSNASDQTVGVWLSDGPIAPVQGANARLVHGTATVGSGADSWVNAQIDLDVDLPAGTYNVIGFSVIEATALLGRLIFPQQGLRPMCVGRDAIQDITHDPFLRGDYGVLGSFQNFVPPKIEVLKGGTGTSVEVFLNVVKSA